MDALATVTYPGTKKNIVESGMVADQPSIDGMKVKVVLEFPRDTDPFLKSTVKVPLTTFNPVKTVNDLYREEHR